MMTETIRLVAAALQHETYGVNALLPDIPRDASDAEPAGVEAFLDPTQSEHAARGDEGPDWPALMVLPGQAAEAAPEVGTIERDAEIELVIAYISRDADRAETFVEASLTLRAVERCIAEFLNPARDGEREREQVYVIAARRWRILPWHTALPGHPDIPHDGARAVRFQVRDLAPLID